MEERIVSSNNQEEDHFQQGVRPVTLEDYVGQQKLKDKLKIYIEAARERKESLDHVLLYGPPGLGKTTLANIISREMGVNIRVTSGPALERPGDLASILTNLEKGDVLFVDEIHRLPRFVEEVLYPAMEDYALDVVIGKGPGARTLRLELPSFTLVGATVRAGLLSSPLRDRFGVVDRLDFYSTEDLEKIIKRSANILGISVDSEGAREVAICSRGTPRIANRLLRRIRDYAQVKASGHIDYRVAREALEMLELDRMGLDHIDRRIMETIIHKFGGGPVGIETIATSISEETRTIEDVYEPYLMKLGFIKRTPRGREVTPDGYRYLNLEAPEEKQKRFWS